MMRSVEAILTAVERLPAARLEIDAARRWAAVQVRGRVVARIDLRHGRVVVSAPAETIPTVQRVFAPCSPTANGIAFDVADVQGPSEALAAIGRRVNVERFVWQLRVTSP